ncbi:hypothetical protein ACFVT5_07555 [Streptomyces sp. NPDC058001]|uniref:hypothetical protein n=1 Tax=Streptomyces sp. NPDC058001 TaxID=3346300 RepID=UPI0036E1FFF4
MPRGTTPGHPVVARLAICREEVRYRSQYGYSAPQVVESLALLTPDRQPRVLGITAAITGATALVVGMGLLGMAAHVVAGDSARWVGPVAGGLVFAAVVPMLPVLARRIDARRRCRSAHFDAV